MAKLRKMAADLGLTPKPGSATAKKSAKKLVDAKGGEKVKKESLDHADSVSDNGINNGARTPPVVIDQSMSTKSSGKAKKVAKSAKEGKVVSGRVTKTRTQARAMKKVDDEVNDSDETVDKETEIGTKVGADEESVYTPEDIKVETKVEEGMEM